ncbi:MAG: TIGR00296 family protein [Armatimonadetes bacterium]|nr:TIGR00296 family protein [Armatimonadota bacterium]MDW8027979.1 TIGR00296 family protein [Armatimonadota bacterium]
MLLDLEKGKFLLKLARQAIESALLSGEVISAPQEVDEVLRQPRGVFVTLHEQIGDNKILRGCIGLPYPVKPLVEATIESALKAAFHDPRFPPLGAEELEKVTVEVSVLTTPKLLETSDPKDYPSLIVIGRDGLIVESDWQRGLLLPQVAVEHGFDAATFLDQTCLKAGLPKDAWLKGKVKVYTFQAQIFAETEPKGEIVELTFNFSPCVANDMGSKN